MSMVKRDVLGVCPWCHEQVPVQDTDETGVSQTGHPNTLGADLMRVDATAQVVEWRCHY